MKQAKQPKEESKLALSTKIGLIWLAVWVLTLIPSAIFASKYTPPLALYEYSCSTLLICPELPLFNQTSERIETPYTILSNNSTLTPCTNQVVCVQGNQLIQPDQVQINRQTFHDQTIYIITTTLACVSAILIPFALLIF